MSFISSSQKHFNLDENSSKDLFLDCASHLFSSKEVNNKEIVSYLRKSLEEKHLIKIPQQRMYEILSQIMGLKNYNVALSKEVKFKDIFNKELSKVLEGVFIGGSKNVYLKDFIPTGIKELDNDLGGGLQKGYLSTILSPVNFGKSLFCVSIASNALRSNPNLKVLYVSLEGLGSESTLQFCTNLNNDSYRDTFFNLKSSTKKVQPYNDRLMTMNRSEFNYKVETLIDELRTVHNNFAFDLVVIDYPQLLDATIEGDYRVKISEVYRSLVVMAHELNCALLAPAQASNKDGILRSTDISWCFEIARMSSVILTLNNKEESSFDVFLDKSRSTKDKIYKIKTNFSGCNLIN